MTAPTTPASTTDLFFPESGHPNEAFFQEITDTISGVPVLDVPAGSIQGHCGEIVVGMLCQYELLSFVLYILPYMMKN